MVDNSELDYMVTFFTDITTSVTVASYETKRNIANVSGTHKLLIFPPETMSTDGKFYKKRYLIKLSVPTEANMTTVVDDIIEGCDNYNKRQTVTVFPPSMCNVYYAYGGRSFLQQMEDGIKIYG